MTISRERNLEEAEEDFLGAEAGCCSQGPVLKRWGWARGGYHLDDRVQHSCCFHLGRKAGFDRALSPVQHGQLLRVPYVHSTLCSWS